MIKPVFDPLLGKIRMADAVNSQLAEDMSEHIRNKTIHVTQDDKDNWNKDTEIDTSQIDNEILLIK